MKSLPNRPIWTHFNKALESLIYQTRFEDKTTQVVREDGRRIVAMRYGRRGLVLRGRRLATFILKMRTHLLLNLLTVTHVTLLMYVFSGNELRCRIPTSKSKSIRWSTRFHNSPLRSNSFQETKAINIFFGTDHFFEIHRYEQRVTYAQ